MNAENRPAVWKTLLAFSIIYLVWGSTFLAIRVGVREAPPLLYAAMRFVAAGVIVYGWMMIRREPAPTRREWGSIFVISFLVFVGDYGLVFWAEQRVPSGLTAVMLGTIPVFMALSEICFLRTRRLTPRLAFALIVGLCGVAVLVSRSLNLGGAPIDRIGAIALILAAASWSVGSALMKKMPLPSSKLVGAGAQMLAGGFLLLVISALLGEFQFRISAMSRDAWLALIYLIVFGSIIAFSAYTWLIHHESPTKVGTYAYVNPVIAVLLGYLILGEPLGLRTILGTALVLVSVILITTGQAKPVVASNVAEDAA